MVLAMMRAAERPSQPQLIDIITRQIKTNPFLICINAPTILEELK
jgi:hypothetical protein